MEGPEFLKKRYNTHSSPEVQSAAKRTFKRTSEKVPQKPTEQIQNYLDRFKEIIERKDPEKREKGLTALKKILHEQYIIKPEDIPESYFELQQQIAREQGHGNIQITEKLRAESVKVIQADQRESMDMWIDYLSSDDALYPDWTKYWAFRSVLGMSSYDKEKHEFAKHSKKTTAPFPDLNREALAYVVDAIEKKIKNETLENPVQEGHNPHAAEGKLVTDEEFKKLLNTENFAKYYAFAIEHVTADSSELYKITEGEWRVFKQDSDAQELTNTLQGHGTGWCTAAESTARIQLEQGDFHIYYSLNNLGEPTIPRVAIRMEGDHIAEIRGVAYQQEIDPYISPVLTEKIDEFGDQGEEYKKKVEDMKLLTKIDNKQQAGGKLSVGELRFLYELDGEIEGFGYETDPRIDEIRTSRNVKRDLEDIFNIHTLASDKEIVHQLITDNKSKFFMKNIQYFDDIGAENIIKLADAGYRDYFIDHCAEYIDIDETVVYKILDQTKEDRRLEILEKLEKARGITSPESLAKYLISEGENDNISKLVLNSRLFLTEESLSPKFTLDSADARRILSKDRIEFLQKNLYLFKLDAETQSMFAEKFLSEGGSVDFLSAKRYLLSDIKFDVDTQRMFAEKFVNDNERHGVYKLNELRYLLPDIKFDKSLFMRAASNRNSFEVGSRGLQYFSGLDVEAFDKLIDIKQSDAALGNIWRFSGVDWQSKKQQEVLELLIEEKEMSTILKHSDKFPQLNLDKEFARKVLASPDGDEVLLKYAYKFSGFDAETGQIVFDEIVKTCRGYTGFLRNNVHKRFKGLKLDKEFAKKIIISPDQYEYEKYGDVALLEYVDKFSGLDAEIGQMVFAKIVKRGGNYGEFFKKYRNFKGLKLDKEFAKKILTYPKGVYPLMTFIDDFKGLDQDVALLLLKRSYCAADESFLRKHFSGIDDDFIEMHRTLLA